jgi:hypothetical protein
MDDAMGGERSELGEVRMIQLRGARIFQGGVEVARPDWWRGRLASIDGWSFGRFHGDDE